MWRFFLGIVMALLASHAMAGSRGFVAVMMDIGGENFFESRVYGKNRDTEFVASDKLMDCWNRSATGGGRFDWIIKKNVPPGLTQDLAQAIWDGNKSAMKQVQQIMRKAQSPDGHNEIDGMYIIKAQKGKVSLIALGSRGPIGNTNPSTKISIPWNEKEPSQGAADFDLALCSASKPFGFGFKP
jgi:hypothetical protein